jgi:hypothetical protein
VVLSQALSRNLNQKFKGDAMRSSRKIFLSLILVLTLLTTACPNRESISKVLDDPGRYRNKDVAIGGRVTDSFGLLGNGAYELDDGTGKIWVITRRGVPSRGAQIGVKGRVHNGFTFSGRSFGTVLEEDDRRSR